MLALKKSIYLILVGILALACFSVTGCQDEQPTTGPEKTIAQLEEAYNERNVEGLIEIYKPDQQAKIKERIASAKLLGAIIGNLTDFDVLQDIISEETIFNILGSAMGEEYVELRVIKEEYNEDNTKATVTVEIDNGDKKKTETVEMIKISDKWYLSQDIV